MIFTSILKSKENDQLSKLNHSWILADALAEFNRKQCIKAYELCVEACTLYEGKETRESVFVWLLYDAPFTGHEQMLVHDFLYNYLYA